MSKVSRNEIIDRIEYIMSYLLSKKYDADIKVHMKKEEITNGNIDKTGTIEEE